MGNFTFTSVPALNAVISSAATVFIVFIVHTVVYLWK